MITRTLIMSMLLVALVVAPDVAPANSLVPDAEAKQIRATVERVRSAIISENTQALLQEISRSEGLECTDTLFTYAEVKRDLNNKNSIFYKSLFNAVKFRTECGSGYPYGALVISEKEFYAKASHDVVIEALGHEWVKVIIRSPIESHYERWLYLHKEGASWKVGGGFVIGECTCG